MGNLRAKSDGSMTAPVVGGAGDLYLMEAAYKKINCSGHSQGEKSYQAPKGKHSKQELNDDAKQNKWKWTWRTMKRLRCSGKSKMNNSLSSTFWMTPRCFWVFLRELRPFVIAFILLVKWSPRPLSLNSLCDVICARHGAAANFHIVFHCGIRSAVPILSDCGLDGMGISKCWLWMFVWCSGHFGIFGYVDGAVFVFKHCSVSLPSSIRSVLCFAVSFVSTDTADWLSDAYSEIGLIYLFFVRCPGHRSIVFRLCSFAEWMRWIVLLNVISSLSPFLWCARFEIVRSK